MRDTLIARQQQLLIRKTGGLIMVEGECGIGKTTLVSEILLDRNMDSHMQILCAAGNPFERGALVRPFAAWGSMLRQLIDWKVLEQRNAQWMASSSFSGVRVTQPFTKSFRIS